MKIAEGGSSVPGKKAEGKEKDPADEFKNQVQGQSDDLEWQQDQPYQGKKKKHDQRQGPADHQKYKPEHQGNENFHRFVLPAICKRSARVRKLTIASLLKGQTIRSCYYRTTRCSTLNNHPFDFSYVRLPDILIFPFPSLIPIFPLNSIC